MAQILIIEDDVLLLEVLAECLQHEYKVATAQDGVTALEVAESFQPDLIICDIGLPRMDGFSVFRHMQKVESLADVPFIFLSGDNDKHTIRQGMALGADDFLTKPVSLDDLLRAVQVRLEKSARREALLTKAIDELRLNVTTALPHELRTAIMIMEGYTYLVLEDADRIDPVQRQMIEAIHNGAVRLRNMAEKYLWYLKAYLPSDSEKDASSQRPNVVIENVAIKLAQRFNREADLELCIEKNHVQVSDEYLGKLVEEIIENAFKFSAKNTPVSVLGAAHNDQYVITVCNNGRAMTPEQVEHIGAFTQFDRMRYEQQGTGLGLTIAKRLIELSEGNLFIASNEGVTRMVVTLPLAVCEVSDPVS